MGAGTEEARPPAWPRPACRLRGLPRGTDVDGGAPGSSAQWTAGARAATKPASQPAEERKAAAAREAPHRHPLHPRRSPRRRRPSPHLTSGGRPQRVSIPANPALRSPSGSDTGSFPTRRGFPPAAPRAGAPPSLLLVGGGRAIAPSSRPAALSACPPCQSMLLLGGAMAKIRVAYEYTEAEDKSLRLGLFLIVSGIVSLFILGFCWLNPALQDLQGKAANCTVLSVQQIAGQLFECTFTCGADCKGTSLYPCLQVYVNNSESNARALLHQDEHQLLANPKCSYIPPCERENEKNSDIVAHWQVYWEDEVGSQPFTCYFNQHLRPDDVLLRRTHDESVLLHCFLWPMVTFLVGVLIVVLTICAKSLAVKAEAMKKRKHS